MFSSRRIRRDDFDIESIEKFHDRENYKSRSSGSPTRSRSRKRSYSRRLDNGSRSRSRSVERKRSSRRRESYSRSRSRSRSRGYSRRSDRRTQTSRRHRDSRSRSYTRSRSRSRSYSRHQSERYRYRRNHYDDRNKRDSHSCSRSRSSSHFREIGDNFTENQNRSPNHPSTSSSMRLANVQAENADSGDTGENLEDLPLPQQKPEGIYQFDDNEPIDRARIHREMEEKLRAALAKEGKVYPPPKTEASHPVFANDGSFLEIFKKMQQAQASTSKAAAVSVPLTAKPSTTVCVPPIVATANPTTAPYLAASATGKSAPPPSILSRRVGRRGGKILKTGVVAKPKVQTDTNADPKDFWSLYLAEVNKYKNTACESEQGNRPLVK